MSSGARTCALCGRQGSRDFTVQDFAEGGAILRCTSRRACAARRAEAEQLAAVVAPDPDPWPLPGEPESVEPADRDRYEPDEVIDAEVIEQPETRKDRAAHLLLQAAAAKVLERFDAAARKVARGEYDPTEADAPSYNGVPLGRVRMDHGRVSVRVTDSAAALRWTETNAPEQVEEHTAETLTDEGWAFVRQHHPEFITEVVVSRAPYASFINGLLAGVKKAKGAWPKVGLPPEPRKWTDPDTGQERNDLPSWIDYGQGDPILNVTPTDEAVELVAGMFTARLPELES